MIPVTEMRAAGYAELGLGPKHMFESLEQYQHYIARLAADPAGVDLPYTVQTHGHRVGLPDLLMLAGALAARMRERPGRLEIAALADVLSLIRHSEPEAILEDLQPINRAREFVPQFEAVLLSRQDVRRAAREAGVSFSWVMNWLSEQAAEIVIDDQHRYFAGHVEDAVKAAGRRG